MLTDNVLDRLNIMDIVDLIEKKELKKLTDISELGFYYRLWMTGLYDNRRTKYLLVKHYKSLFDSKIDDTMKQFEKLIESKKEN